MFSISIKTRVQVDMAIIYQEGVTVGKEIQNSGLFDKEIMNLGKLKSYMVTCSAVSLQSPHY